MKKGHVFDKDWLHAKNLLINTWLNSRPNLGGGIGAWKKKESLHVDNGRDIHMSSIIEVLKKKLSSTNNMYVF